MSEIQERKDLRDKLLKELYEYNFSGSTKPKSISAEIQDTETRQAYIYLAGKNYIELSHFEHPTFAGAKITSYGIDYIEQ